MYAIIFIILLVPAFLFFFKPELSLNNKFLRLSWGQGLNEVSTAIKNKKSGELFNKIYGNFQTKVDPAYARQSLKYKYYDYLNHSKNQAGKFIQKWKVFIS